MKAARIFAVAVACLAARGFSYTVIYSVNTSLNTKPISKYIYGVNSYFNTYKSPGNDVENWTIKRQGGDHTSAYNWENNFNNCGNDNGNANSDQCVASFPSTKKLIPGIFMTDFIDSCIAHHFEPLITVQMAGWVAADNAGTVTTHPPSGRWKQIVINKGSAYTTTPDKTDAYVYVDEMVNMLVSRYGRANTATGVKFYDLDNEPNIWSGTHPVMHPAQTTCAEMISKSVQTAAMIKRLDPYAMVVGPVWCPPYSDVFPEWVDSLSKSYRNIYCWYLDKMKKASDSAGVRLIDVFDLHYMSTNFEVGLTTIYQAVTDAINSYFPGTKIGSTEWTWGFGDTVTTAFAVAYYLGTSARYGTYLHTFWAVDKVSDYLSTGVRIFRNYDGQNSTFGDTLVQAASTGAEGADTSMSRVFASTDSLGRLHIILINKKAEALNATFAIASASHFGNGDVYQVTSTSSTINKLGTGVATANNSFTITVPLKSMVHIVLPRSTEVLRGPGADGVAERLVLQPTAWSRQVNYTVPGGMSADLIITDAAGRIVRRVPGLSGSGSLALDRAGVPAGVYLVSLKSGQSETSLRLMVSE